MPKKDYMYNFIPNSNPLEYVSGAINMVNLIK